MMLGLGGMERWRRHPLKWRRDICGDGINDIWRQVDIREKVASIAKGSSQRVGKGYKLTSRDRLAEIGLEGCGKVQ